MVESVDCMPFHQPKALSRLCRPSAFYSHQTIRQHAPEAAVMEDKNPDVSLEIRLAIRLLMAMRDETSMMSPYMQSLPPPVNAYAYLSIMRLLFAIDLCPRFM